MTRSWHSIQKRGQQNNRRVAQMSKCQNVQNTFLQTDNWYTHKRFSSITKYSCQWILSGNFCTPKWVYDIYDDVIYKNHFLRVVDNTSQLLLQVGRIFALSPLPDKQERRRERRDVAGCHVLVPQWTCQDDLKHTERSSSKKISQFPPNFWSATFPLGSKVPTLVSLRFGNYQAKLRQKKPGMP